MSTRVGRGGGGSNQSSIRGGSLRGDDQPEYSDNGSYAGGSDHGTEKDSVGERIAFQEQLYGSAAPVFSENNLEFDIPEASGVFCTM